MLGGQAEPGSSEVFERDAARYRTAGSVRAVPVEDERARGSAASTAAITAGHTSRAEANRPRILFDGISRSEHATAPSMTIPNPSLESLACRPTSMPTLACSAGAERALVFIRMSFALRGAPCGNDSRRLGAVRTRGGQLAARTPAGATSNCSPDLATATSRRPEPTWPRRPFAQCQSRTRHFAGIPRSISARTAGHASNVDENRPTTLFEGMRRIEYSIAPSIRMSRPSPGRRAYRPSSPLLKSYSTERSTSALFVRISFALRGAPCGDDLRAWPAFGGYHDEKPTKIGPTDGSPPVLQARVFEIGDGPRQREVHGRLCLSERHAILPFVLDGLVGVPIETDHTPDTTDRPSPASYHGHRPSTGAFA